MRLGVDLGGSKIELVALAPDGAELFRRRTPTPAGDYMGTVMTIAGLVEAAEQAVGDRGTVGVGIPGAESPESGLIKNANSTCLIGKPLRRDLQVVLQRPVRLANDANCFALSEATDGAGAGAPVVFGVILGTGVGGGLVVNGAVLQGANRIAGEWGHNPLPSPTPDDLPAPLCYCGRSGCIETYLSGPAAEAEHLRRNGPANSLFGSSPAGRPLHPAGIPSSHNLQKDVACAAEGDAARQATLDRYALRLARSLAGVINIVDPDVIVLGGGLSNIGQLYDAVPRLWAAHIFSDVVRTRLLPPQHGDSSGVRGAAWLWNR